MANFCSHKQGRLKKMLAMFFAFTEMREKRGKRNDHQGRRVKILGTGAIYEEEEENQPGKMV